MKTRKTQKYTLDNYTLAQKSLLMEWKFKSMTNGRTEELTNGRTDIGSARDTCLSKKEIYLNSKSRTFPG